MAGELSAEAEREIRQLQKSKEKWQRLGKASEAAAACERLGEILAGHGRFRAALREHRDQLRFLEAVPDPDPLGCAVAHRKIGERLAELRRFPQALWHQRQHLLGARALSDALEEQRAWATVGRTFLLLAEEPQPPEPAEFPEFPEFPPGSSGIAAGSQGVAAGAALGRALEAFQTSLDIVETRLEGALPGRDLAQIRSRLFLNLGLVQESLGNGSESARLLRDSARLADESQVLEDQFRAYFNLGLLQHRGKEFPESLRSLGRAREFARSLREPQLLREAEAATGQVLLSLGDFGGARRALRRALARGDGDDDAQSRQLRHCQRHVSRVCRALAQLSADPDPALALALCERLGDSLARLGHFQRAADFYQRQLALAEAQGAPGRDLAVIHVSLATTFRDLGQHSRALEHFRRELELRRGEPLEECRTWLNVALALEDLGSAPDQILPPLRSALGCAEAAGDSRLQRQVLRRLRAQQLRDGDLEGAENSQKKLGEDSQEEEEEEEEEEESESESESESELSESEEEDEDLEGYPKSVPGRRRSNRQWNRRNERGETPLHRACIEGDLKKVRLYLDQGHPVNPRDYCGWTPLHEAANHGHLEVARLLLERGAARDDAGGPGCEGLTPLHDALASGRFPVAQLLIRSGASLSARNARLLIRSRASLSARNARGQTPLDTLQEWLENFGSELDAETWASARETLELLGGQSSALPDPPQESQIPESQTPNPGIGAPSSPLRKRQRIPEAEKPEKKRDLGKSGKSGSENPKFPTENPEFPPEIPKPALIPLEEFLEQEDWLEDDLGPSRKKARKNPWEFRESRRDHPIPNPGTSKVSSRESQIPEDSGRDPKDQQEFSGIDSDPPEVPESSGVIPNSSEIPESSGNSSQIPVLRIRIRIQDDVFLIPVAPRRELSVAWLAERAAERFSRASGTFPRLRLRKAGALLAPHDAVTDLLSSGDEVQAEIEGWDLPPLPERYRRVCASLGLAPFPPLLKLLELQSQNSWLEIPGGIRIPPAQIPAFLRSLKLQEQLRELRLRNLGILDSGISELGVTLVTLPRLLRLDLAGTGIGSDGIRSLCAAGEALKCLEELELSRNPLGGDGGGAVWELLRRCPALLALHARSCGLEQPFIIPESSPLRTLSLSCNALESSPLRTLSLSCNALESSPLRTLSLSCNALGPAGLRRLLRTIPGRNIRNLELDSVSGKSRSGGTLGTELGWLLRQSGCSLRHLSLAGNHLRDSDVQELAGSLPHCPSLESLDLSANPELGSGSFRNILEALEKRERGLEFLNLAGCGVGDLDGAARSRSRGKIRELRLPGRRLWNGA